MKIDLKDGIIVRDSVVADIKPIADNMRKSDKDEIWASHNRLPINALALGYGSSTICLTIEHNGIPCAMFGVYPESFLSDKASVWLLATNRFCMCRRKLVRHSKGFIDFLLKHYQHLENYVDVRNKASIRWLEFCGAKLEKAKPFGVEGKLFQRFSFERNMPCAT